MHNGLFSFVGRDVIPSYIEMTVTYIWSLRLCGLPLRGFA